MESVWWLLGAMIRLQPPSLRPLSLPSYTLCNEQILEYEVGHVGSHVCARENPYPTSYAPDLR